MHWIQRHILIALTTNEHAKYTELIPEGVEGNLFSYHLKQLVSAKLIGKNVDAYELTSLGKRKVATMSLTSNKDIQIPRIFAMVYLENKNKEICLFKWDRQPYLGHVSLPFDRVIYGTSILETAKEALLYKTGLSGELDFAGTASVLAYKEESPSTHYIAHIYRVSCETEELYSDGMTGRAFWGEPTDYSGNELVYGTKEILELLNTKKSPFFEEILIQK